MIEDKELGVKIAVDKDEKNRIEALEATKERVSKMKLGVEIDEMVIKYLEESIKKD